MNIKINTGFGIEIIIDKKAKRVIVINTIEEIFQIYEGLQKNENN